MYLSLGSDVIVKKKDIIGIFDLDKLQVDGGAVEFLRQHEKNGMVTVVGDGIPKAFVLVSKNNGEHIYITTVSASSLRGRSKKQSQ